MVKVTVTRSQEPVEVKTLQEAIEVMQSEHRAAARCSGGMEPSVRSTWSQSTTIVGRLPEITILAVLRPAPSPKTPYACRPNLVARNGIFGCGDRAAKITARDGQYPQRQKRPLPMAEIPAQTAYLDPTWKSAVRKDWVVVCAVACEPVSTEYFPVLRENNRVLRDF
jgi:hypothetical protein